MPVQTLLINYFINDQLLGSFLLISTVWSMSHHYQFSIHSMLHVLIFKTMNVSYSANRCAERTMLLIKFDNSQSTSPMGKEPCDKEAHGTLGAYDR